ncbi:Exopolyphosphatase [Anaerotruncus sp. 2789STDY5834896]|uniref:Exopolyphosphatase n=1 Tax=uncultured Anaerotruncus sp. TaxID=905011 RepID=A0A1C6K242_9FIRM|nr:Exopolyphosphatase [uncultured Anaerotruncus sp.]
MTIGIIDMGSNSIRLSVYRCTGRSFSLLFGDKQMAALAGCIEGGDLTEQGVERACGALTRLLQLTRLLGVVQVQVFATASLRQIRNRTQVLTAIEQACGVRPQVLSGKEEALCSLAGAMHATGARAGLVCDIGGGSTELVGFADGRPLDAVSLPLGSLSLSRRYVPGLLPTAAAVKQMRQYITEQLCLLDWPVPPGGVLCGIGGTVRACGQLYAQMGGGDLAGYFPASWADELCALLASGDEKLQRQVFSLVPERILTLVPGVVLLGQIAAHFGCRQVQVSAGGVREGYLLRHVLADPAAEN